MSFEDDEWGRPVEAGEFARVDSLQNRLLIVFPIGYIEHSPTRFSQPGRPSDVIVCDAVDLDDFDEAGNPGKIYRTAWWRPSKLVVALRPWIGKRVLGRLTKGVAQNGMNAPWVITDCSQEPGALDRARAWAAANPNFAPSPFIPPAQFNQPQGSNGFGGQRQPDYGPGYRGPAAQQQPVAPQGFPASPPQYQDPYAPPPQPPQPQPAYSGYGPPQQAPYGPQYRQQSQQGYQQPQQAPPPPPQPQYQSPAPPQQQAQYQQGPPMYPVQGAPQDPGMLERMRAERARREEQQAQDPWADQPPF